MKPLSRQLSTLVAERMRFIRFAVVGGSGVIVNMVFFEALLWLLQPMVSEMIRVNAAAVGGFAISFCSNFLLNHYWTWGDRTRESGIPVRQRFLSYFAVASSALLVQITVLNLLSDLITPRFANVLGIGAGTIINFAVNHFWTFGDENGAAD